MFGILLSSFNSILGWTFRAIVIKFVLFTVLFLITTTITTYLSSHNILPDLNQINNKVGGLPSSVAYIFNLFQIYTGISMIISAYITRFMIRRIPKF